MKIGAHVWNDPMKCASFVTETMLASRQLSKVSRGIRNNVVKKLKYYSTKWLGIDRDIELDSSRQKLDFQARRTTYKQVWANFPSERNSREYLSFS